ncbi:EAL domain-containing protein [Sedimenticola thiotaurini]|uniref:EAL domain-containing protein n=1 Tax=Sedimenticola thiotaurini TaxID=1543721 RepID=UPI00069B6F6E
MDGLIYPDQFIGEAEESSLIDELTDAVLIQALHHTRDWLDQGIMLHVSVNISMENLKALDFPDRVVGEADAAGVPLKYLVLELTESRLLKNLLMILDILTRLRLRQVSLSIDDFGTGHSSLVQLRDLPFDELKVDRSFVHLACRNTSSRAIYEASVEMAAQLGMTSVAEGVEDLDDWEFLQSSGGDLAQGYFIARPMPVEALPEWLADWELRRPELIEHRNGN